MILVLSLFLEKWPLMYRYCMSHSNPHWCIYLVLEYNILMWQLCVIGEETVLIFITTVVSRARKRDYGDIIYSKCVFYVSCHYPGMCVFVKCTGIYSSIACLVVIFFISQEFYFLISCV